MTLSDLQAPVIAADDFEALEAEAAAFDNNEVFKQAALQHPGLSFVLVDNDAALKELCTQLSSVTNHDFIAVDTEFMRITCYYPDFSLMQLAVGHKIYIVDVLQLSSINDVIAALCETEAKVLVFSGAEDLELLAREARRIGCKKFLPDTIYDLQLMMAFCGHSFGRGLNFALQGFLGITLAKDCTRSNWNVRPLSSEQLVYGALDVFYLERLFHAIRERMSDRNFAFFEQEMQYVRSHYEYDIDENEAYLTLSAAGMLTDKELNILQFLAKQRILKAREENCALNRVITTKAMWQLAKFTPRNKKDLERRGVKHGTVLKYGDQILSWLNQAKNAPRYPNLTIPYDYFSHQREMQENFDCLRRELTKRIAGSGICPQVIMRKHFLNDYFRAKSLGQVPLLQQSWRYELLGPLDVPLEPILPLEPGVSSADAALMDHMAEELCSNPCSGVVVLHKDE